MELPQDFEVQIDPSKVSITEDGKKVMRPDILNFLMLASINAQTARVRRYFDDRKSKGNVQPYNIPVTDEAQDIDIIPVAQSISLFNDGPNTVYYWVNNPYSEIASVNKGESTNINFETHEIKRLILWCDAGETASLRIIAKD